MIKILYSFPLLLCIFSGCGPKEEKVEKPIPPSAAVIPFTLSAHGDTRVDPYYWMNDRTNGEVIKYLEEENAYTKETTAHLTRLEDNLYHEMLNRMPKVIDSVPEKWGDYYYFSQYDKNKQYAIFYRKDIDGHLEAYLDPNELSKGKAYFAIDGIKISPDQKKVAYLVDTQGAEVYNLYIKDLESNKIIDDQMIPIATGICWANDNKTLYYTTYDDAKRPYRVYQHIVGMPFELNRLIYEEKDPTYRVTIDNTRDKKYITINTRSILTSEVYLIDADDAYSDAQLFQKREHGIDYSIDHQDDHFLILTNKDGAKNFKLMQLPDKNFGEAWQEFIPYNENNFIEGVEVFKNYLAIFERTKGFQQINIYNLKNDTTEIIPFDESNYDVEKGANREYDTHFLRFAYSSLVTPFTIFDYNMESGQKIFRKQQEVKGYHPDLYQSETLYINSHDGTAIPVSIVYRKDKQKKPAPLLLNGYGAYGVCNSSYFSSERVSLLDRGIVYAIAHIRGGNELGRSWYDEGKGLKKKNTFLDFIYAAQSLIDQGYTTKNLLAIEGRSAGGLLIGAVLNMRPDLFKVAVAGVPFVDVVTTMSDPSIPLTVNEYEEWGNPEDKTDYFYMKSYSPYDNVEAKNYPNILILAGLNDPRVAFWEPAKWAAKLRALKTDNNLLLLKVDMHGGHMGSAGRLDHLKEKAFEYAFILDNLGLSENKAKIN